MKRIDWYLDFISPFAYLASEGLGRLPKNCDIKAHPILFAGLLRHWHTRGPAEIEPMRRFTFRHIRWLADRNNIPLTLPPVHPFNPLKLLRLSIALDNDIDVVQRLFRFVWAEGRSSDDPEHWQSLVQELGVNDADSKIGADKVKNQLRQNGENAIAAGLFGVPSFVVDEEIFWGFDAMDFLLAYLQDPAVLQSPGMRAVDNMPDGLSRSP